MCLVDVDYYIDMPKQLARCFKPHLVYTMVPDSAAAVRGEYSYTFDAYNRLTTRFSGGGDYCHWLWDYGKDFITVTDWSFPHYTSCTYHVDRRLVAQDR